MAKLSQEKLKERLTGLGVLINDPDNVENLQDWAKGMRTNPSMTRDGSLPAVGDITSIDPHYQIMMMTAIYGRIGKGWTYTVNYIYGSDYVSAEVTVQIYDKEKKEWGLPYGPVARVESLHSAKGGFDKECAKKAMTNALTKALSHTGLNADVFLGMFDCDAYVKDNIKKHAEVEKLIKNSPTNKENVNESRDAN
jgi:hypothetical protein